MYLKNVPKLSIRLPNIIIYNNSPCFYSILFGNSNIFLYLCLFFARVGETLLPERKSKSLAAYITIQLQRKMEIITIFTIQ